MMRPLRPVERLLLRSFAGLLSAWLPRLRRWHNWAQQRSSGSPAGDPLLAWAGGVQGAAGGPPAHWLDLVSRRAPWLLESAPLYPAAARLLHPAEPVDRQAPDGPPPRAAPAAGRAAAPRAPRNPVRVAALPQAPAQRSEPEPVARPAASRPPRVPRPARLRLVAARVAGAPAPPSPSRELVGAAVSPIAAAQATTRVTPQTDQSAPPRAPAACPGASRDTLARRPSVGAAPVPATLSEPPVEQSPGFVPGRSGGSPAMGAAAPGRPPAAAATPRAAGPVAVEPGEAALPLAGVDASDRGSCPGHPAGMALRPEGSPATGDDRLPPAAHWPALPVGSAAAGPGSGPWPVLLPHRAERVAARAGEVRRQEHLRRLRGEQEGRPWSG